MQGTTRNYAYFLSLLPSVMVCYGNWSGGLWSLGGIYVLVGLAIFEWIMPVLKSNQHTHKDDVLPKVVLYLHPLAQLACLVTFFVGLNNGTLHHQYALFAAIGMGVNSGSSAIVVAHEFIHHKNKWHQFLGRWLLFTTGNFYFFVEHLRVHHKWVGTEKDSATAKKNQSLYAFFLSSSSGQFISAFKLENERLRKEHRSIFSFNHYVIRQLVLHACLDVCVVYFLGWAVLGWYVLHCVFANFLLEYVNYIEHYGLERGEKQRVTEIHSWQSDQPLSRFFLIDLSRHADHHYYASKPYHTLETYAGSPELPSGYAGMFIVAALPPWWFKMMNKRIPTT